MSVSYTFHRVEGQPFREKKFIYLRKIFTRIFESVKPLCAKAALTGRRWEKSGLGHFYSAFFGAQRIVIFLPADIFPVTGGRKFNDPVFPLFCGHKIQLAV